MPLSSSATETEMRSPIAPAERLIVALDVDTRAEALQFVRTLGEDVSFYKVGLQLFMQSGLQIVRELVELRKKVFLDLKIDDTPRTIREAVRNAAVAGVEFFTLQGDAGTAAAARLGRGERSLPKFLQVTLLSSWDKCDLAEHLHTPSAAQGQVDLDEFVLRRSERILASGCDGVIASGSSVSKLRSKYPDLLIVTPGIRPSGAASDDHKRSLTPSEAIRSGANYLVVGRPIRDAGDPKGSAARIQDEITRTLAHAAA
jgi:orotidine-5'-phosphate decarboxylase